MNELIHRNALVTGLEDQGFLRYGERLSLILNALVEYPNEDLYTTIANELKKYGLEVPHKSTKAAFELVREAMRIADEGASRWQEAEELLKQVIQNYPQYTEAKLQLALLWTRGMRNKYNVGSSFTTEGNTYSMDQFFSSVNRLLKEVMKSESNHPGPYYCYACWSCFPLKKSYSDMRKFYKKAQSFDTQAEPQYYIFHSDVALAASEKSDRVLAVDAFYWAHRTGKETGDIIPGSEPAYTYWQEAREKYLA